MDREIIKNKYNGLCGYCGKPLDEGWQIDHIKPKRIGGGNDLDNLIPTIGIVNHYKRALGLEGFRKYMNTFHLRLGKLPKNTKSEKTLKRKEYLQKVADLFGIDAETPFKGKFYFEEI